MISRALAAFVLATTAVAQVVVVPVSGGGAALENAILAAPNDAVLVVAPGTYSSVTATLVAKNVTVIAPAGATVAGTLWVTFTGVWRLTVVGITMQPSSPSSGGGGLATNGDLYADQCSGTSVYVSAAVGTRFAHVQRCTFLGGASRLRNVHAVLLDATFVAPLGSLTDPSGLLVDGSGSLRAERVTATGGTGGPQGGAGIRVDGDAVLVDCVLTGGVSHLQQPGPAISGSGSLTLSNCTLNGPVVPTPVLRPVPSAEWVSQNWTPGGTSVVRFKEAPNELVATVASLDLVPWTSPFAMERLYVGATPGWLVVSVGVTGASGDLQVPFTLPNTPAAQYATVWLTGAFVDPLPLRTTCPLGGLVR
jgi:hypothetical protein